MEIKKALLKDYTSLRVGGEVDMVTVTTLSELVEVVMLAKKEEKKIYILGGGTNTYFGEDLDNLLVIKIYIKGISFEENKDDVFVTAYAGEEWDDLVRFSVDKGLWGLENLSLIPGTVGSSPVQNIGAYGVELKDVFVSLSALDMTTLNVVEISKEGCDFEYRDSLFKKEYGRYSILSVRIKLSKKSSPVLSYKPLDSLLTQENLTASIVRDLVIATRIAKLPDWKIYPNAGSFFKNPIVTTVEAEGLRASYPDMPQITHQKGFKIPAAWLIERVADMKGVRIKDLGTWPNQPLVVINYGSSSADDVDRFTEEIRSKILLETGIALEQEVNRIG